MIKIRGIIVGWINKNASGWLLLLTTLIYSLQSTWHDLPQDNTKHTGPTQHKEVFLRKCGCFVHSFDSGLNNSKNIRKPSWMSHSFFLQFFVR